MSVQGWARCQECKQLVTQLVCWPNPAHAIKHVCPPCYTILHASSQWLRSTSNNTAGCVYPESQAPAIQSPPTARVTKHRLIPAGCEYRFLFALWWVHRGLMEPLRNRVVRPDSTLVESEVGRW